MTENFHKLFTQDYLTSLFPEERADNFFEALYGDTEDGAYDISLEFKGYENDCLLFEFHLKQRPGKCLACNLTYGLPNVFSKHPIINVNGIVDDISKMVKEKSCSGWKLGSTHEISRQLHVIPLQVSLN